MYALGEPCKYAVEIAYSNDSNPPEEHCSPGEMGRGQKFDYPVDAAQFARESAERWKVQDKKAKVKFTVVTGGGMISPEIMTLEELEAWAAKRYNGLPEKDKRADVGRPLPEQQAIIDRFRHLEDDRVRLLIEPDEIPYDDSYFDSWDVCEEELEDLKDDCARTIEREGVWRIQPQFLRKGVWEDAGYGCCGYLGPIEWVDTIEHMAEALDAYDAYVNEKNEKAARKLARRATYAGPTRE
jgi:hypothetical protein